jgi:hypothetical protein
VVLRDAGGPALSRYDLANGSTVWFYHHTPGLDPRRDDRILGFLMKQCGVHPVVESEGTLYARDYRHSDGMLTYPVFARPELDHYRWVYSAQDNGLYPWRNPGVIREGSLHVPPGSYRMFGMLSGIDRPITVGPDGLLPVRLDGITADVIHLVPQGNRERYAQLKQRREELFRFLSRRIQE